MFKQMRRRRVLWVVVPSVVVVAVLTVVLIWWLTRDDAPPAVDLEAAVSTLDEDGGAATSEPASTPTSALTAAPAATPTIGEPTAAALSTTAAPTAIPAADEPEAVSAPEGVNGLWAVDTSIGEFSYEDSTGTFVGFRVDEELTSIGSTTAVGRTPVVTGSIAIDGETVTAVTVEADMSAITTNDSRRDRPVQSALNTAEFPTAVFTLTEPVDLGPDPNSGDPIATTAVGELTVKGTTQPVQIALEAQLVDDTVVVVGSTEIVFADYDVSVPRVPIVLSAEDHGIVELQLFFARSP
ncbi:YceI family protein [Candidatus Poriferisocius sp.]|uniref:YceI family protein n=1 Tax=Candidatus Poriferisocius sp. TaxID=3101276 RepID=UPI003B529ED9